MYETQAICNHCHGRSRPLVQYRCPRGRFGSYGAVKSVLNQYLTIQTNLANDSIQGLEEHASAIAKAVKGDDMKMLAPDLAKQAETLTKATDLKAAREAFKPLSASLIKYLADNKAGKGTYHETFCPMVKASWLQMGTGIKNPYMGKAMLTCGEVKS